MQGKQQAVYATAAKVHNTPRRNFSFTQTLRTAAATQITCVLFPQLTGFA